MFSSSPLFLAFCSVKDFPPTILKGLDIKHFILGRNGIEWMAAKSNGWVYYLGGLAKDQDPYDMLKLVVDTISGFSLKHPMADARDSPANDRWGR